MQKLRVGMIGGSKDAFIGNVHRLALALDGEYELVCGAFSRDPKVTLETGQSLGLKANRCYKNYQQMLREESNLPLNERMQVVSIVTPNFSHFEIASLAIKYGFHVFCEKPITTTLADSYELLNLLQPSTVKFALAHTYCGYPMVMEAKHRIAKGQLGKIQKVVVDYSQGWLANHVLSPDNKQAKWRLDPTTAGASCCMADIGIHAANLAEFISGHKISRVLADLAIVGEDRQLDDDGTVLLRFDNKARGILNASQVCVGEENNLSIKIYGEFGHLFWQQMSPNKLTLAIGEHPIQTLSTGNSYLSSTVKALTRTPSGHPEGYLEAFANLYRLFRNQICQTDTSLPAPPGIEQGISGMAFIEAVLASEQQGNQWVDIDFAETEG